MIDNHSSLEAIESVGGSMQQHTDKYNLAAVRRRYTNPYDLYDGLRQRDSIYHDSTSRSWLVTGYAPVESILADEAFRSNMGPQSAPQAHPTLHTAITRQMIFMDGETHRRARNAMMKPLALAMKRAPDHIRSTMAAIISRGHDKGEVDLVQDLASPLSLHIIARVMGIPSEDREELKQLERWSDTFTDITSGYLGGDRQDVTRLLDYFRTLVAAKRDMPSDDLLSALIAARESFPEEEDLIANCVMLFAAGRVTTKKLLGNGIPLLLRDWDQWRGMSRGDPSLGRRLADEMLRFVTPTRYLIRSAREEIDLSGKFAGNHLIRQGEKVFLFLEAANHDPAYFASPADFDPRRGFKKHLAFGHGPHRCPGAALAYAEAQIALEMLFLGTDLREMADVSPVWNPNPNVGGYASFPVLAAS